EDVQPPEPLDRPGDEPLDRLVTVQVAGEGQDLDAGRVADLLRRLVEIGLRAAAHRHPGTLRGPHLRAGAPEPPAGPAHARDRALQLEIHHTAPSAASAAMAASSYPSSFRIS